MSAFRFPSPLYPIADPAGYPGRCHVAVAEALVEAGVRFFQLRVKEHSTRQMVDVARAVKAIADRAGTQLIINDRVDVAMLVDAAGVHLGQDDLPAPAARRLLGERKIIGVSTHDVQQIESALTQGAADYLAFGPIFATTSKQHPDPVQGLEGLRRARQVCPLPLVAIGGITAATISQVLETGADAAALIGAIAQAVDPLTAARDLLHVIGRG